MSENIPKTELLYPKRKPIDHLDISEGIAVMIDEQKLVNGEEGCLCNIDLEFVDNGAKQGLVDATLIDEKNKMLIKQNITHILDVVLENNS